jgi:hypothetical protein
LKKRSGRPAWKMRGMRVTISSWKLLSIHSFRDSNGGVLPVQYLRLCPYAVHEEVEGRGGVTSLLEVILLALYEADHFFQKRRQTVTGLHEVNYFTPRN